jgi:adenine-specific DNA-methyltransferase
MKKQKLELTWIGKDTRPKLEPRILLEDPAKSYHAKRRLTSADLFDNRLIFGDNLLALKALEAEFSGKVKCVFIDPPYNTGSAFTHYDDGVEHSIWLSLMRDRMEIIRRLLAEDGSLWITIDDNEAHYLKVLCDEVFGRANFVANVVWQKKYAPANDALWLSDSHDHVLVFAKSKERWRPNKLPRTQEQDDLYTNGDNDSRGPWMSDNYTCAKNADERPNLYYAVRNPNTGEEIWPKRTRVWAFDQAAHQRHVADNMIYWGKDGKNSTPRLTLVQNRL